VARLRCAFLKMHCSVRLLARVAHASCTGRLRKSARSGAPSRPRTSSGLEQGHEREAPAADAVREAVSQCRELDDAGGEIVVPLPGDSSPVASSGQTLTREQIDSGLDVSQRDTHALRVQMKATKRRVSQRYSRRLQTARRLVMSPGLS
jgi:hypothetical protein